MLLAKVSVFLDQTQSHSPLEQVTGMTPLFFALAEFDSTADPEAKLCLWSQLYKHHSFYHKSS